MSIGKVYESIDKLSNFQCSIESQIEDAQETVKILADHFWDWVIVDYYALDSCWEKLIRGSTKKIMVIDDLANHYHECDLLLDQNFSSEYASTI